MCLSILVKPRHYLFDLNLSTGPFMMQLFYDVVLMGFFNGAN